MRSLIIGFVAHALCLTSAMGAVTESCTLENQDCIASKPPVLMQTSHKLAEVTHAQLAAKNVDDVEPYQCENYPMPGQVLRFGNPTDPFKLYLLDRFNGEYQEVYTIPYSWTSPPFEDINGCAISPISSVLYCTIAMPDGNPYVARIGASGLQFVGKLPATPDKFIAGTFGPSGVFHFSEVGRKTVSLYKIPHLDADTGFSDQNDPNLADYSNLEGMSTLKVADWVAFQASIQGHDSEWIMGVTKGGKKTVLIDTATNEMTKLNSQGLPSDNAAYGAGWNFQNRIFFASNDGEGVFEANIASIDIAGGSISYELVGKSVATDFNDGLNCLTRPPPSNWAPSWITTAPLSFTSVTPFDCDQYEGIPLQVILNDEGDAYDVKHLDITTGHYTELYSIPRTRTTPPYKKLNSCGISPISKLLYCGVTLGNWNVDHHELLVRVDAEKIEFVAKIPWVGTGGNFNPSGDTYYVTRNAGGIYSIPSPDSLTGYADYTDVSLTDLSTTPTFDGPSLDDVVVVTALHELFDDKPTDYVVGIPKIEGDLVVAAVEATGEHRVYYSEPVTDDSLPAGLRGAFGAAFSFQNKMYFTSNRGSGVFEVELSTISNPPDLEVKVKKMGKSDPTSYNDGMNCLSDALKH